MQGERDYYSVEKAAEVLGTTPARVLQMVTAGDLEGLPPGASAEGVWKVLLPVVPEQEPAPDEAPTAEESAEDPENTPEPLGEAADVPEEPPEAAAVEDLSRGDNAATDREVSAPSGWVSTQQAARALNISPRTVRWHIEQGNLEAKPEGEGVKRTWLVSIDSLQAFRDARQATGEQPRDDRVPRGSADIAAESPGSAIRELAERLAEEAARAAEFRVRLELTEQAQSTLQAELEEERRRRVAAERARDRLRRALEGRRATPSEPSESSETAANEQQGRGPIPDAGGPQEPAQPRPWWRRMFGG
ncbi:MAG: helix-turn-helix domain-containing protein [Chloroflexota bacterium]|nr:helix-turn-helix domain-containing protein [Chloroflexota bacterium]